MKIIFINTLGQEGGAGRAAFRLLKGLQNNDIEGLMLAQSDTRGDPLLIGSKYFFSKKIAKFRKHLDSVPTIIYPRRKRVPFSSNFLPDGVSLKLLSLNPEIIHLHWISGNFIRIESFKSFQKPIIWTMHDMWPFTGGCHFDFYCGKYRTGCGYCPILGSQSKRDLSHWNLNRKYKAWKNLKLTLVTPSNWLAQCVKKSLIFKNKKVYVIPNGLNLEIYRPYNKKKVRTNFSLPIDKKLVLFGGWFNISDERKGIKLIKSIIDNLIALGWKEKVELVTFGSPLNITTEFKVHNLGPITNELILAKIYSMADVFVTPSLQDNLPNTVMEAIGCGTPCVAFNIGGMSDMIVHKKTGFLADPFNLRALSYGITWVLSDDSRWKQLSHLCRMKAKAEFEIKKVSLRYRELYKNIINETVPSYS